jgi:hypothetical protein
VTTRKPSKRLVSTYVLRKTSGKFEARVVDARTKLEGRCSKDDRDEAISCSRGKVLP